MNALVNMAGNLAMRRVASQRKSELSGQLTEKEDNEDWWKQPWSPEEMEKLAITMADFEVIWNCIICHCLKLFYFKIGVLQLLFML